VGAPAVGLEAGDDVDLIYASMSPFGTAEAASAIAAKLATPWVADLRDPWALDEWRVYTSALHRRLELGRMRTALSTANAVIMNTPEAARAFLRDVPGADGVRVHSIPNGYDASDFAAPAAEPGGRAFRIVHAGHVHTEIDPWASRAVRQLLRGEVRGLDISTRSHVYLLKAVSTLIGDRPELRSRLEVHLAGALAEDDLASLPLDVVHAHGYLPHREMIDLLKTADLLFLPMHDLPQGTRARLVPGKTYEYLGSRKPILAAVPDGDARDLLAQAGNAFLVRPKDVNGMVRVISEQMERASRGEPAPLPREEVLAQYERRQLTARLAAIFDQVVGDDGSAVRAGAVAAAR
jgi:glycosyltransferase involved in cell wall biosynthesis